MAKRPRDLNQLAKLVVDIVRGEADCPVPGRRAAPRVRSAGTLKPARILLFISGRCLLIQGRNSTESRHRTIIYDQPWSSAAGVRNLVCAPDWKSSCDREAKEDEAAFSKTLPGAFRAAAECKTVQLIVAQDTTNVAAELLETSRGFSSETADATVLSRQRQRQANHRRR